MIELISIGLSICATIAFVLANIEFTISNGRRYYFCNYSNLKYLIIYWILAYTISHWFMIIVSFSVILYLINIDDY